jgi:hypothetical protein
MPRTHGAPVDGGWSKTSHHGHRAVDLPSILALDQDVQRPAVVLGVCQPDLSKSCGLDVSIRHWIPVVGMGALSQPRPPAVDGGRELAGLVGIQRLDDVLALRVLAVLGGRPGSATSASTSSMTSTPRSYGSSGFSPHRRTTSSSLVMMISRSSRLAHIAGLASGVAGGLSGRCLGTLRSDAQEGLPLRQPPQPGGDPAGDGLRPLSVIDS